VDGTQVNLAFPRPSRTYALRLMTSVRLNPRSAQPDLTSRPCSRPDATSRNEGERLEKLLADAASGSPPIEGSLGFRVPQLRGSVHFGKPGTAGVRLDGCAPRRRGSQQDI